MGIFAAIMKDQAEALTGFYHPRKLYTVSYTDYIGDAFDIDVKAFSDDDAKQVAEKILAYEMGWGNYQILKAAVK